MSKSKVMLFKCYQCKVGSPKEEMEKVVQNKKTKDGGEIYRYYHRECLALEKVMRLKSYILQKSKIIN